MHWEDKYFQSFILSLVAHALIYLGLSRWAPERSASPSPTSVEIFYNKSQARQIVRDPEIGEIVKSLQREAKALSRLNRRVKEETVARRTGITQNKKPSINLNPEPLLDKKIAGLANSQPQEERVLGRELVTGESTISDYLPNVKRGGFTALNTNQFTYYSFFTRINDQIYNRWTQNLRAYIPQIPRRILRGHANNDWITRVEMVFDREGYYLHHRVVRSSGNKLLDLAVVQAFQNSAPFLNPPLELVEPDGRIRLHYEFYLALNPKYLATK